MVFNFFKKDRNKNIELESLSRRLQNLEKDESLVQIKDIIKAEFKVMDENYRTLEIETERNFRNKEQLKIVKEKTKELEKSLKSKDKEISQVKNLLEMSLKNNESLISHLEKGKSKVAVSTIKKKTVAPVSVRESLKTEAKKDLKVAVTITKKTIKKELPKIQKKIVKVVKKVAKKKVSSKKSPYRISKLAKGTSKSVEA